MKLGPIVERLKAFGIKRASGAMEFAALKNRPEHLPAFFVLPEGWNATPNRVVGVHDQNMSEGFGVVIMLEPRALRGDKVAEDIDEEEGRVVDALAGWTHPEASRPCEAVSGRPLSVDGNSVAWLVSFRSGRHIRKRIAS